MHLQPLVLITICRNEMTKLKNAQLVHNSADEQDRLLRRYHPYTPLPGDGSLSKTELA